MQRNIFLSVNKPLLYIVLISTFIISGFSFPSELDLKEIRELYVQSVDSKKTNETLIQKLKDTNENTPVLLGYKGAAFIIMAKHDFYPWNKWTNFTKGRGILEKAIQKYPDNYELRFIRFSIQSNLPAILNYSSDIVKDRTILVSGVKHLQDKDLKKRVVKYLKEKKKS